MDGKIIFLNGTSSAGKSSIAIELQKILGKSCHIINIDRFMKKEMSKKALELDCFKEEDRSRSWWDEWLAIKNLLKPEEAESIFVELLKSFYEQSKIISQRGNIVIIDMVLEDVTDCLEILHNLDVLFVLIYCPLEVIKARIVKHNASLENLDKRTLELSKKQFDILYERNVNNSYKPKLLYDLIIDSSLNSPEACAQKIKDYADTHKNQEAFNKNYEKVFKNEN